MNDKPSLSELVAVLENEESISHYGVLGMKWGVRKSRGQKIGSKIAKKKKKKTKLEGKESDLRSQASEKRKHLERTKERDENAISGHESRSQMLKKSGEVYVRDAQSLRDAPTLTNWGHRRNLRQAGKKEKLAKENFRDSAAEQYMAEQIRNVRAEIRNEALNIEAKADKYRRKIEKNDRVIEKLNTKLNTLSAEEIKLGKEIMNEILKKK